MANTLYESNIIDNSGEIGSIFALGTDRVVKLYRVDASAARQDVLMSYHREELRAYALAGEDPILSTHVPRCYGVVELGGVVDTMGHDASAKYMLNLSVELERLEGTATKRIAGLTTQYPHIKRLVDRFWECGIYALDASVFHPEDAENCNSAGNHGFAHQRHASADHQSR